jgi:hypothetical protein
MNKVDNKTKKYFTQIPNDLIRNSSISDRARFLYCYMSSMSENWEFYQGKMAKDLGYSKDTLRKYLDELVSTGYLKRTQRRSEKGRFDSYDYIIDFIPNQDFTVAEKPRHGENPTRENPALKKNNFKEEQFIKNINLKDNIENHSDFTDFTKVETNDFPNVQSPKVNPFTVVAKLQSEKEKAKSCEKNEKEKAERQPFPTYAAFSVFCQTFENLSGAAYPTDQNGHYIMMPKDAGQMGNLLRYIDKIDRQGDSLEALKVFIQAAWNLNDKWLRANFTIANIYGQASKIFTAYQTTSPAAKDKAYNDRIQELLAERMAKFQD